MTTRPGSILLSFHLVIAYTFIHPDPVLDIAICTNIRSQSSHISNLFSYHHLFSNLIRPWCSLTVIMEQHTPVVRIANSYNIV